MSSKLFRLIWVFIVIMVITAALYKSLLGENSESWEKAAFESLKATMQEELVQLHWQWQYEGRPSSILYIGSQARRVQMNAKGWPAFPQTKAGCHAFLDMFASDVVAEVSGLELDVNVEQQLGINIEFLAQQDINDSGALVDTCRYTRLEQKFEYYLGTGSLF
jgi:hypothetical protein